MGSPSKSIENKKITMTSTTITIIRTIRSNLCIKSIAVFGFIGIIVIALINQQQIKFDSSTFYYTAQGEGNSSTGTGSRSTQIDQIVNTDTSQSLQTTTKTISTTATNNHKYITIPQRDSTKENKPIKQISVLGERNSGTRWTVEHIEECFNHSIKVVRRLTRHKHWFQYEDENLYNDQTLVIAQFRNPYEWLKAMEHVPHHSPAHLRTLPDVPIEELRSQSNAGNDWKIFLTKEWTTERLGLDLSMKGDEMCQGQERFPYKDIVSCAKEPLPESAYNYTIRFSENEPFYEMRNDGSGIPYNNIMEMRSDKILNHLNVKNFKNIADVWVVQYEYLLANGTQHLLDRIEEWTNIKPNCVPKESQNRPPRKSRMVNAEYAKFVRQQLNWTIEALVGYYPEYQRES